jgi:hypothetical protein
VITPPCSAAARRTNEPPRSNISLEKPAIVSVSNIGCRKKRRANVGSAGNAEEGEPELESQQPLVGLQIYSGQEPSRWRGWREGVQFSGRSGGPAPVSPRSELIQTWIE